MKNNRKPRIAVIGAKGFPAWGGAARSNEAVFSRLKDRYDVTVYAISSHASDPNYQGIRQVIFKAYKNRKLSVFLYYIKSLFHALFRGKYDLMHVNHRAAGFLVPFLRLRFPVVLNVHGMTSKKIKTKWRWYEDAVFDFSGWIGLKLSNTVVTVGKSNVCVLERLSKKPVFYIPNGTDCNKYFSESIKKNYDIVFAAARIIYLKGLHDLLSALNNIQFKGKVLIIGDLNHDIKYKKLILELSAGLNCEYAGLIFEKSELFNKIQQAKCFVFPSHSEGMSNMLLEVASLKVPILASDIPSNIDVFNDNIVLFFKAGNANDLAVKIHYVLGNTALMNKKADNAFSKVINYYSWDNAALSFNSIYENLLAKKF